MAEVIVSIDTMLLLRDICTEARGKSATVGVAGVAVIVTGEPTVARYMDIANIDRVFTMKPTVISDAAGAYLEKVRQAMTNIIADNASPFDGLIVRHKGVQVVATFRSDLSEMENYFIAQTVLAWFVGHDR